MILRTLALLSAVLLSFSCGQAQCLALCVATIEVTLVDGAGAAVTPGSGTVTLGSTTEAFDCTQGTSGALPDGGTLTLVRCDGNKLVLTPVTGEPSQLTLEVTRAGGGASFSGNVALSWADSGENLCGSVCRKASPSVTLQ